MKNYSIKNLSFTYPGETKKALDGIDIDIEQGEFITICGKSGCGKTTLLRLLKSTLAPCGKLDGEISFMGKPLSEADERTQAAGIGFVMQSPDNQIVTDKVWHELAFGLESLGFSTPEIRARVGETASFFGIQTWFHKKVTELSGGQKQILTLASVMAMQPSVLILDEPTSRLDPIAAEEFLKTLEKINRELGTTVIISEHRLGEAFPISDRVIVIEDGRITADGVPSEVGAELMRSESDMCAALPAPMRIFGVLESGLECPVTVREGRLRLETYAQNHNINTDFAPSDEKKTSAQAVVEMRDVWFGYGGGESDVIRGMSVKINRGELFAAVGGNGAGKTTMLSLISGINSPKRGKILINGKSISETDKLYGGVIGALPQNPQSLFVKKSVRRELEEMLSDLPPAERDARIREIAEVCRIGGLLERHPYDLSGGEQQMAAFAKVLLAAPKILLLDEPTKGLDAHFKQIFADILIGLKENGTTIIMVSHDLEFCAEYADRCALVFDGGIASEGEPRGFFAGKSFYTTSANRMARTVLLKAVLADDVLRACGKEPKKRERSIISVPCDCRESSTENEAAPKRRSPAAAVAGIVFTVLFVLTCVIWKRTDRYSWLMQLLTIFEAGGSLLCLLPKREIGVKNIPGTKKHTAVAAAAVLAAVPLTIFFGMYYLEDRKYYFISMLIILETLIPFAAAFESRKPRARELVIISVLCTVGVAGRAAFFMLPQFKPVAAVVIITGICFGAEAGFLTGAVTAFVSNFFFGQGPWTPWQMLAFGIIGFVSGLIFANRKKTKISLCIFGFFAVLVIYGGIINPASVIMWQENPTLPMIVSSWITGLPFDLIHAASTVFFLWFAAEPMTDKLERVKVKYGLTDCIK